MEFKSDADNTNLKPINAMHQGLIYPLDSAAVDSLNMIAATITPDNNIEVNYKEVFELALKNPTMKDSVYLPADIKRLRIIAHLCPFTDGNAVYSARVILHAFEPDSNYYNYCEFAKRPERESSERHSNNAQETIIKNNVGVVFENLEYKIIPNPNNGTFSLLCPGKEQFTYSIYDSKGSRVIENIVLPNENIVSINLSNIAPGLYNVVITTASKRISLKFNIIRN